MIAVSAGSRNDSTRVHANETPSIHLALTKFTFVVYLNRCFIRFRNMLRFQLKLWIVVDVYGDVFRSHRQKERLHCEPSVEQVHPFNLSLFPTTNFVSPSPQSRPN